MIAMTPSERILENARKVTAERGAMFVTLDDVVQAACQELDRMERDAEEDRKTILTIVKRLAKLEGKING